MDMSREPTEDERIEAEIAAAIQKEYALAQQQARVPPVEIVWMRAELRAREEAARKALRPIVIGQAMGVAACAGLLIALGSRFSLSELPPIPVSLIAVVAGGWLVLAPLALYLALSAD